MLLFGSHAYGRPTPESDIDLLVVVRRPIDPAKIRCSLPAGIAFDILVRTAAEVRQRLALPDPFLAEIFQRGRVLWDRSHASGSKRRRRTGTSPCARPRSGGAAPTARSASTSSNAPRST
ncbi:MAG: nucleotidyltransferase domain-containing protein [Planctomycetes bacterium]|nr:nucleotidyltransferase domain-containing protein [Planctomycetota bacterium]